MIDNLIHDYLRNGKINKGRPTKRNHYIPCFWSSCWNIELLNKIRSDIPLKKGEARNAKISVLKLAPGIIRDSDSVESCFYQNNIYNSEYVDIRRIQEINSDSKFLAEQGIAFIIDIENIFCDIEQLYIHDLLKIIKTGQVVDLRSKTILSFFIYIQLLRTPLSWQILMQKYNGDSIEDNPLVEMQNKIKFFSDLKSNLCSHERLFNSINQYLNRKWKIYKLENYKLPLADNFVTTWDQRLFISLAPDILLEIDTKTIISPNEKSICDYEFRLDDELYYHFLKAMHLQAQYEIIHSDSSLLKFMMR